MKTRFLRVATWFVCFSFSLTSLNPVSFAMTPEVSSAPFKALAIPTELGQVTDMFAGSPGAPALIHIQSAHGNYTAEKNIESLLGFIEKNSKVRTVLLEGAASKLQPELFRLFPKDPGFNRKVTDKLMQEGYLTGPESFLVNSGNGERGTGNENVLRSTLSAKRATRMVAYGIEDLNTYKKDRDAFIKVVNADKQTQSFLMARRADLSRHFASKLNKDLLTFVRQGDAFDSEALSFEAWLKALEAASAKHLRLDLAETFNQVEWPFLVRYERLHAIGSKIDSPKARAEAQSFLKELEKRKISQDIISSFKTLLAKPEAELFKAAGRSANSYSSLRLAFDKAFGKLPKDFSMKAWPNWTLYAQYAILTQEIEGKGLHEEIARLKERVLDVLAKTSDEKEYVKFSRHLQLLRRLFALELTREEYETLQSKPLPGILSGSASQATYEQAMDFYATAVVREQKMFANALKKMDERKEKNAVLVTGGFHAEGLKKLAASQGCAYLQITPRIDEISKRDHEVYLRSILGARDFESSQMSALLALDQASMGQVLGAKLSGWLASVRELVKGLINSAPVLDRPVLLADLSHSSLLGNIASARSEMRDAADNADQSVANTQRSEVRGEKNRHRSESFDASRNRLGRFTEEVRPRDEAVSSKRSEMRGEDESGETKMIYFFGADLTEGNKNMKDLLGGKGANLAKMASLGLPVPPGFTITTDITKRYFGNGNQFPDGLREQVDVYMRRLERVRQKKFGNATDPLLVSVRSGAKFSMPGMMDTILNVGMNDKTVEGLAAKTGDRRFAYDSYRRLLQMYGETAMGASRVALTKVFDDVKKARGLTHDEDNKLTAEDFEAMIPQLKEVILKETGREFPQDPKEQLLGAIEAVFRSSNNKQANDYRRANGIPQDIVSAVNVQSMVFGNLGNSSATGVLFSRDTATGKNQVNGEYLINAQGEDVVAGIRKGSPIADLANYSRKLYAELMKYVAILEKDARDAQDMEFTIEEGKLFLLQTRDAKRTATAMVRMAVEMAEEGMITKEEALLRTDLARVEKELMHRMVDPKAAKKAVQLAKGVDASPGAAIGQIVFDSERAEVLAKEDPTRNMLLVRDETSPEDLGGMLVSKGILTRLGGNTSHAALVARGQGIPAVVGVSALDISFEEKTLSVGGQVLKEGDWITIDGSSGKVYAGKVATVESEIEQAQNGKMDPEESIIYGYYSKLLAWADEIRRLGVWANADTPKDALLARRLGAEGIGLTRTEHMFANFERVPLVQAMFLSKEGSPEREKILQEIGELQQGDFEGILAAMEGLPVTIRLLDPPMHEFLPKTTDTARILDLTKRLGISVQAFLRLIEIMSLSEENEGVAKRLGLTVEQVREKIGENLDEIDSNGKKLGLLHEETVRIVKVAAFVAAMGNPDLNVGEVLKRIRQQDFSERAILEINKIENIAKRLSITSEEVIKRIEKAHESNPMLGLRGVRLGLLNPSIMRMQVRAMARAYVANFRKGIKTSLKIMVPNVSVAKELIAAKKIISEEVTDVLDEARLAKKDRDVEIGVMIETPAAALRSGKIAQVADFFSFGTNDLSQGTFMFDRDGAAQTFLPVYIEKAYLRSDPTKVLDADSVQRLVATSVQEGRAIKPWLNIGVCGEHGGEPESVGLFDQAGLTYVSASPLRLPIARLAAAQSRIRMQNGTSVPLADISGGPFHLQVTKFVVASSATGASQIGEMVIRVNKWDSKDTVGKAIALVNATKASGVGLFSIAASQEVMNLITEATGLTRAARSEIRASEPIGMEGSREFYKKIAEQGNVIAMSVNMRSKFMLRGIFRAAKLTNAPVLIQRSISEFVAGYKVEDLARDAKEAAEAEGYTGDWILKLDHGTILVDTEEAIQKVIGFVEAAKAAGYGSFSIDASKLVDFKKPTVEEQQKRNIEVTARIVKETSIENAAWEGEIGEIVGDHNALSTPEEAVAFIKGIESQGVRVPVLLAINNGSEHGNSSKMKINLEQTKKVVDAIAPWGVLINQHGITGTPLNLFAAIAAVKIINGNVGTHWQNIMWEVLRVRRPEIVQLALTELKLDAYRSKTWDKTVRKFEPRLNELLAGDEETIEAISVAIAESGVEHFNAFGSKSPSLVAARSEMRAEVLPEATWIGVAQDEVAIKRAFGTNGIRSDDIGIDGQRRIAAGTAEVLAAQWREAHPKEDLPWIMVGFDPRPQGEKGFTLGEMGEAKAVAEVFAAYGFKVLFVSKAVAAPFMISASGKNVHPRDIYAAAMRTASHNEVVDPKSGRLVSGFKLFMENAPAADSFTGLISAKINDKGFAAEAPRLDFDTAVKDGKIVVSQEGDTDDPDTVEFRRMQKAFDLTAIGEKFRTRFPGFKIAINTMNGGMSKFGPRVFQAMGFVQDKGFWAFNTALMNDPSMKSQMTGWREYQDPNTGEIKKVRFAPDPTRFWMRGKEYTDFVAQDPIKTLALLIDGDADRLVAELGKEVIPNEIGMLAAYYLAKYKGQKGRIVRTVPTTGGMDALAQALELGEVAVTPVGSKWFAGPNQYYDSDLKDVLVAVEESGHIVFRKNGELFFDHSIGLAMLMLEMMAGTGKTWPELSDEMWAFIEEKTGQKRIATVRDGISKDEGAENYYPLVSRLGNPAEDAFRREFAVKMEETLAQAGLLWKVTGFDITDAGGAQLKFEGGRKLFPRKSGTDGSVRLYVEVLETERGEVPVLVKSMRTVMDSFVAIDGFEIHPDLVDDLETELLDRLKALFPSQSARSETRSGLKFGVTPEFLAANKHKMVPLFISGGESPGVNDLFAETTRALYKKNPELIAVAIRGGIRGFTGAKFYERVAVLDYANIGNASMDFQGGIAAGTSRINLLKEKEEVVKSALENMSGFHSFLAIGGGDHALFWMKFKTALETEERFKSIKKLGLEVIQKIRVNFKTIDGDVPGAAIGFNKAFQEARRTLYSRLKSHANMIPGKIQAVRIMGATAGLLAVMAGGRNPASLPYMKDSVWGKHRAFAQTIDELGKTLLIVIPEAPVTLEEIVAEERKIYEENGSGAVLISEGASILVDRAPVPADLNKLFQDLGTMRKQLDTTDPGTEAWTDLMDYMKGRFISYIDRAMENRNYALVLKAFLWVPAYFQESDVKKSMLSKADEALRKMSPSDKDPLFVRLLARSSRYFDGAALGALHKHFLASRDPHGNPKVAETTPEALVDAAIRKSFYRDHPEVEKRKDKDISPRAPEQIGYDLRGFQASIAQKLMTRLLAETNADLIQSGKTEVVVMMSPFVDLEILEAMQQVDRSAKIPWGEEWLFMDAAMEILRKKDLVQIKAFDEVNTLIKQLGSTINALHWWSPEQLREQGVLIPEGFQEPEGMAGKRELFHKLFPSSTSAVKEGVIAPARSEVREMTAVQRGSGVSLPQMLNQLSVSLKGITGTAKNVTGGLYARTILATASAKTALLELAASGERSEGLARKSMETAMMLLGLRGATDSDVFVLGNQFFLRDPRAAAGMRKLYGQATLMAIVITPAEQDLLETLNQHFAKEGLQPIVAVNAKDVAGFRARLARIRNPMVRPVLLGAEVLPEALQKLLAKNQMIVTEGMYSRFVDAVSMLVADLVKGLQTREALGRSA